MDQVQDQIKGEGMDWYQDIKDFMTAMEQKCRSKPQIPDEDTKKLRIELIKEEVNTELLPALVNDDLVEIADAAADSIVVILGMCIAYGIDLRPIWDEVHTTNMAKKDGPVRLDGKRLKPPGWVPPDIGRLLSEQNNKKE